MNSKAGNSSATRVVQALLVLIGVTFVVYAISDNPFYGGEPGFGMTQIIIGSFGVVLALCALLPNRISSRILLVTVSILITLAFAEIVGEYTLGPRFRPVFQYDDTLIFKFIPNRYSVTTRIPLNGGESVIQHINSEGFRGPELMPPGKETRVVVYGDSFIHAYYSSLKETFVAQLGTRLANQLKKNIDVVNAGVSSYGPDQELLKMEDELPKLRPDLIIVAIYAGNDYGDLMRDKMFRLDADGTLVENHWQLDPSLRNAFELSQRESILKRALRSIFQSTHPADISNYFSMDFLLAEAGREYQSFIVDRNDIVTNTHIDYYSADVSLTPKSDSARYKVALMKAVMKRIRDVAKQNDTPLVFLFIPHPVDVTDNYDNWKIDRKRFPDYNGRNQIAPLEDASQTLGVPYVSLYDIYRKNDANSLYFHGGNDHWNAAGQRMAAEVTADFLIDHNLLRNKKTTDEHEHTRATR